MDKFLKLAESKGASYAEVMSFSSSRNTIEIADGNIKEMSSGDAKLYSVRLIYNNKLGMAYSYLPEYKLLVDKAVRNAKANGTEVKFGREKPSRKSFKTPFKINPLDISLDEKKDNLLKLDIRKEFKHISSLKLVYADSVSEYSFLNNEGGDVTWCDTGTAFVAWPFSKLGDDMQNFFKIERMKGGYELMDKAEPAVREAIKKAEMLLTAKRAKGGNFPTIVDPHLGGVFAHEAIGHACEADHVLMDSSILKDRMGERIGSDSISIIDDGTLRQWGWTPFDSEGVKGSKTQLLKKGVLKGWLHNRETAGLFGEKSTGNGRSQSLGNRVIPRMTTTYAEKGDSSFEEILSHVKKGYYLKGSAGGQVDPAGGQFLFNAQEGYYVENGEVKHMVKGVSLVGNILEALHNITLVAKDLEFGHGSCGKGGQYVPVSDGAPHFLILNAKVGGSQ